MDRIKRTRGRQKIVMKKIEKENDRYATFSKRRQGLFTKASDISTLCDADIGIFIFSPTGKPFSFFHPSMEAVISRLGSDQVVDDDASRLLEACSRTRVLQLNQMLEKIGEKLDEEESREKEFDGVVKREKGRVCGKWWQESALENLDKEQVGELIGLLKNMQLKLGNLREENEM